MTSQPTLFTDPAGKPRTIPTTPRQQPIPPWLLRQLEAAGHIDPTTGATRAARMSLCPKCRQGVMRGIDADWCGMARDCDPTPLTPLDEAVALLARRNTFSLHWIGKYVLHRRDRWQIQGEPARSKPGMDVLIEHQCGLATGIPHTYQPFTVGPPTEKELTDEPPF